MATSGLAKVLALGLCLGTAYCWIRQDVRQSCVHPNITYSGEASISKRIVSGKFMDTGEWPFLISLRRYGDWAGCGGTLVHPQFVVTAMHCVRFSYDADGYSVKIGEHHLHKHEQHEIEIPVEKILSDMEVMDYDEAMKGGADIVLLKLARPVTLESWAKPICLPSPNLPYPKPGNPCMVAGWGQVFDWEDTTKVPKHVEVPIIDKKECERIYDESLSSNVFCAGGNSNRSACHGDSGGPFVCKDSRDTWNFVGVVSRGRSVTPRCGVAPTVFANVIHYIDWIELAMIVELS